MFLTYSRLLFLTYFILLVPVNGTIEKPSPSEERLCRKILYLIHSKSQDAYEWGYRGVFDVKISKSQPYKMFVFIRMPTIAPDIFPRGTSFNLIFRKFRSFVV